MNRKKWLQIKLGLLLLLFALLCVGSALAFSHFGYGFSRLEKGAAKGFAKSHPLAKGETKTFSGVEKIVANSISLPVRIYESDVEKVTVTDYSRMYGIGAGSPNTLYDEDGVLTFNQGKRLALFSIVTGEIVIEVPREKTLEYELKNVSGSISLDAPSKNELSVENISGSTRIFKGGQQVSVNSTSGSVRIFAPFESVTVESLSGSIRVKAAETSKQIKCGNTSGSTRIQLENVPGYEMHYATVSGGIKDTYLDARYSESGSCTYGDASLKLELSSVSGSIKLTDWE